MAKENGSKNQGPGTGSPEGAPAGHAPKKEQKSSGGASVHLLSGGCLADTCKKKSEKAGFCMEHFDWFKEGLITKEGRKPSDFEKKHFNYVQRRKPAA